MQVCTSCGAPVASDARFCHNCAAPLEPPRPSEERKLATVLFADLVGSTELGSEEDPERTRALLERFYDAMSAEISAAGGTVEKFAGDAVMAAFGAPASYEDHAERALHAALSMQRRLEQVSGKLSLRIGINTGEVVVGTPREGSSFVSGDAVNVAARLEQAADPGEILVAERTAKAVGGAFDLGEPVTVQAKGKPAGIVARRLGHALSLSRPRGVAGLRAAFVGRDDELGFLQDAYRRVAQEGRPHLVTIVGEPGVGKTRLIRELWAWLGANSPHVVRRTGRCVPYGHGTTYVPIGEIVREHFGLLESDPPETVRRRLGDYVVLGMTLGFEAPSELHPLAARDRLHTECAHFFAQLASEHPTVILVEDIHWAEAPLLDLLDSVVRDIDAPLLLLATARPELADEPRSWVGRFPSASTVWLEPLGMTDAELMLDAIIPAHPSDQLRRLILERAEGNPFFVEELVGALIDEGVVQREHGQWTVQDAPDQVVIPDSVQGVLAARIDRLAPAEKAALQAASVIGRVFWSGPLYELLEGLEPDLRLLEERDFIRRQSGSSIADEREYAIKHALTREVAYGSLPKAKRARLHAGFASWLERTGEGRDEHAALLAHHYAEAGRPEDADLAWQGKDDELAHIRAHAVTWLRRAAELAVGRYDIEDALSLLHRALELEPSMPGQAELWRAIGYANALYFDGVAFSSAMQRAIALAEDPEASGDLYAELALQTLVRAGMWRVLSDTALIQVWIDRALELTRVESAGRAEALIARCYADYTKSREVAKEVAEIAERLGDARLESYGFDVQALTAFTVGDYEEALSLQRRRVGLVDKIHDPDHQADIYANAIPTSVARGEFEEARRYASAHLEVTRVLSPHHRLHGVSAIVELEELLGNWDRVRALQDEVERTVANNVATPCVRNERSLLVCALANAYEGDEDEMRRLEEEAARHGVEGYGTVIGAPRLQLALHRGDIAQVASLLGEPAVRRTSWFYLSSVATHLDALAALGERTRLESEAHSLADRSVYLEPFALRALGIVRGDGDLLERAAERFAALGLEWHATQTLAPSS